MNRILLPLFLLLVLFGGAGYYFLYHQNKPVPTPLPQGNVCEPDSLVCEDGTVLKRQLPNCDFPPCPGSNSSGPVSTSAPVSSIPAASAAGEEITISGEMICLPHRNTNGSQTMECAYGLKADDGNNYGLSFPEIKYMMAVQIGSRVKITGKLTKNMDQKYNSVGSIAVENSVKLN